jgi:signal transduction histidine kinase/ActR/RegA family two-component response regulator
MTAMNDVFPPELRLVKGEMADRVRAFDWASTPLGPIIDWPRALRIAVGICLSSRFPMFVWWGSKYINIYNDAYAPMLGARHPSMLGRPARDAWDDIWDVVGAQADRVTRTGEATWNERVRLVMRRHGYDEETWFTWSYSPIYEETGRIGGMFCAVSEDTGRVAAERERDMLLDAEQHARTEAEVASRMKDEFLATLSHELRTPLNAILGWSHMLRHDITPERIARAADVIERNARAQMRIIEDLLDMSAIISGKVRLDTERTSVDGIVRAAVETVRPNSDSKGVAIETDLAGIEGLNVDADSNRMQQVLWNLLANAVKFTPAGGSITVKAMRVQGDGIEISVRDTGEGIKPEFLPHVFDRFRQADASTTRRHGGLGLGLAIAKQLVELHGGSIRVESAGEGQGACVTISLPIASDHLLPHPRHVRRGLATMGEHADLDGVRILVVDDDRDAREMTHRLLEESGAMVATANSGPEAFDLVSEQYFDLMVCDIGMPGEDGYSLMRRIRALSREHGGAIPSIALTAYARPEDRAQALRAGFTDHMTKPVQPSELFSLVTLHAAKRPARA